MRSFLPESWWRFLLHCHSADSHLHPTVQVIYFRHSYFPDIASELWYWSHRILFHQLIGRRISPAISAPSMKNFVFLGDMMKFDSSISIKLYLWRSSSITKVTFLKKISFELESPWLYHNLWSNFDEWCLEICRWNGSVFGSLSINRYLPGSSPP